MTYHATFISAVRQIRAQALARYLVLYPYGLLLDNGAVRAFRARGWSEPQLLQAVEDSVTVGYARAETTHGLVTLFPKS